MDSLPAEIIVLIFECICRTAGGLRAGRNFAAFIRTCSYMRDVAYDKFMWKVFAQRAMTRCQLPYYQRVIGTRHKKTHLGIAISNNLLSVTAHIMGTATAEYLRDEAQHIIFPALTFDMIKILSVNRGYFEKIKIAVLLMHRPNQYIVTKHLFDLRDAIHPDAVFSRIPSGAYYVAVSKLDLDFVRRCLLSDKNDVQNYTTAVRSIISACQEHGPCYPWLERTQVVELLDEVILESNFQKKWLEDVCRHMKIPYRVYFMMRHGLRRESISMDIETLEYYLSAVLTYPELVQLLVRNNKYTACILKAQNVLKFTVSERIGIARCMLDHTVISLLLNDFDLEPSNDFWLHEGYFDADITQQCSAQRLDENETAIVKLYVEEEAVKHRQLVVDLLKARNNHLRPRFDRWEESRTAERWLVEKNIDRFITERDDGIQEQKEIDAEQSRIQLSWSQDHYCVPEWSEDIECSDNSDDGKSE